MNSILAADSDEILLAVSSAGATASSRHYTPPRLTVQSSASYTVSNVRCKRAARMADDKPPSPSLRVGDGRTNEQAKRQTEEHRHRVNTYTSHCGWLSSHESYRSNNNIHGKRKI